MGQYGVILDAGSSGTRVYVYKWKDPAKALKQASASEGHILPKLKLHKSKKIHPGVSTFAENVASVGPDHLKALVQTALNEIPASQVPDTPIFLLATAGVRFLPKHQQTALLDGICTYLKAKTQFQLPDCASNIQVISGETEGLYGWIAANYLLGGFDKPDEHAHGKGHHTYGFLDMGGASAQIAFAPNSTEAEKHSNDLKLVRLRRLDGSPAEYKVFTASWLGFGANKARERFVTSLQEQYGSAKGDIPDPCLPKGLRTTLSGEPLSLSGKASDDALVGTGMFEECLRKTYPLLGKDAPCDDEPCLLNGQHVPAIDFDVNHFIGVSEYWHTTHGVFGQESKVYDLIAYEQEVNNFCSQDWSVIENGLDKRKKTLEEKAENAREACFKASWLINVLYEGIGIPRIGLGDTPSHKVNATKALEKARDKGFLDPFQPIDTIGGVEVSWTLGKMVLYAAGQIPPKETPLPVGFGSNTGSEIPTDFEFAGSKPLFSNIGDDYDDDDDDDDILTGRSKPFSSLLVVILILFLIAYLLRKTEVGSRVINKFRRYRKARSSSFVRRLFGRNSTPYERIMEEGGDAAEFELGGTESDETDGSDGGEASRSVRGSRLAGPRLNFERFDDLRPPSVMDRHGLVVRTESCERLAPSLQMLNAGRRSRTGSPTRLKNSIIPQES